MGENNSDIVKLLLNAGASVNTRVGFDGKETVLHLAASWGYRDIIEILLKTPAIELNVKDSDGMTPLDFAKDQGNPEIIQLLIAKGAK